MLCSAEDNFKKGSRNNEDGVLFINLIVNGEKVAAGNIDAGREMVNKDRRKNTRVESVLK